MSKNILIISPTVLKARTSVHDNIDEKLIFPSIKVAQDLYIRRLLGSGLFNKILTDIDGEALAGDYKTLVDDYVIDTLCWYTIYELPIELSYQFWGKGVLRKTSDNTETPSMSELLDIANRFKNRAEAYANELRLYLKEYSTSSFLSEYISYGNGLNDIRPTDTPFTSPIYLGDDGCGCDWDKYYS